MPHPNVLAFSKMHGLGNDFVMIDAINQSVHLSMTQIQFLADRHRGIGCDQLLLLEKPTTSDADFKYRIFNADGSEVAQCGNGVRCFARFVYDKGLTDKHQIAVETNSGLVYPSLENDGMVLVDMGAPRFKPKDIPFIVEKQATHYSLILDDGSTKEMGAVSLGNPHAVIIVDDVAIEDVVKIGSMIEHHARFPERVNVGFMQIISPTEIKLRVFERGVGETQACGTGACAAVVSGIQRGMLDREVKVNLLGGSLLIAWADNESPVWMTGDAEHVYDGEIAWTTINKY